jgi:cysteine desulfurase / selenocysteine lyase
LDTASPLASDFGPFAGRVWLNAAHQGPLPQVAVDAAGEALRWKVAPHRLKDDLFSAVPRRLRERLGRLLDAPPDQIVLGNSTSYGLHLLANGIPLRPGDEVLLVAGDFPATNLPWIGLNRRGVATRQISPAGSVLGADELREQLTPATRVFCTSWVNSFTGHAIDPEALGAVCRANDTWFVLNGTQGIGALPLSLAEQPVDAVVGCGFKWLCGPYGTGFCWMRPSLLAGLEYNQAYWLVAQGDELELGRETKRRGPSPRDARSYDVFGTANFLNFVPWTAALDYLLKYGIEEVAAHDQTLVERLIDGLDQSTYRLVSPRDGGQRSQLVVVSHRDPARNAGVLLQLERAGIDAALRDGNVRFSPHLYNGAADIDRALEVLAAQA